MKTKYQSNQVWRICRVHICNILLAHLFGLRARARLDFIAGHKFIAI